MVVSLFYEDVQMNRKDIANKILTYEEDYIAQLIVDLHERILKLEEQSKKELK